MNIEIIKMLVNKEKRIVIAIIVNNYIDNPWYNIINPSYNFENHIS